MLLYDHHTFRVAGTTQESNITRSQGQQKSFVKYKTIYLVEIGAFCPALKIIVQQFQFLLKKT